MDASPFRCGENYPFQLCNNATNRVLILHGGVPRKAVVPAYSRRQHERCMCLKQENVWGGVRERRGGGAVVAQETQKNSGTWTKKWGETQPGPISTCSAARTVLVLRAMDGVPFET